MVSRIKVVNDVGELVSIFHAADSDVKRRLLLDLSTSWITMPVIEQKYGVEGKRSLLYLDKIKLIESQWMTGENGPEKAYHTYYTSVQINLLGTMSELADIIYATTLSEEKLISYEEKIIGMITDNEGVFLGDVAESLDVSQALLRGIVKRSNVLQIKGYKIAHVNDVM
ncbi:MAG: ArsR family transcriptional regulator [Candidatus Thermoplasmatota archaeon]|jgi:predicted DNA-binding ArsR family transcriptional regulator|nr:ArsR family transcriptional regulator [Candidatus Thermoplasmatota archaeon]MCL5955249.1 ArsR family transcriptional regulator [Candidatus Thermoplasmatota archaeon]